MDQTGLTGPNPEPLSDQEIDELVEVLAHEIAETEERPR